MTDFLTRLVTRGLQPDTGIHPRLPSAFEPAALDAMPVVGQEPPWPSLPQTNATPAPSAPAALRAPTTSPPPTRRLPLPTSSTRPHEDAAPPPGAPPAAADTLERADARPTKADVVPAPSRDRSLVAPAIRAPLLPPVHAPRAALEVERTVPVPRMPVPRSEIADESARATLAPDRDEPATRPAAATQPRAVAVAALPSRRASQGTAPPPATNGRHHPGLPPLLAHGRTRADERETPDGPDSALPTVHVTIGRIEVRAAPPAVAPPSVRRAEPTMTLDRYLRERNGANRR